MGDHATIYRPSSAARVIRCPGSRRICAGLPDTAGYDAAEGSVAHHVADKSARQGVMARTFVGEKYRLKKVRMADGKQKDLLYKVEKDGSETLVE